MLLIRSTLCALAMLATATTAFAETVKVKPGEGTPLADGVAKLEDGDKLVIARGTYAERLLLTSKNDITVIGKGKVTLLGTGAASTVFINNCTDIVMKNLRIGRADADGVSIAGSDRVTLQRFRVAESNNAAFRLQFSSGITIKKSTVTADPTQTGTRTGINGSVVQGLNVIGCRFEDGLTRGVSASGSDAFPIADVLVKKCRFVGNTIQAMLVGGTNFVCEKNGFLACAVGIRTTGTGAFDMRIEKNQFKQMTGQSVVIQNPNVTVHRNRFTKCLGLAISGSGNGPDAVITNNVVRNIAIAGIVVSGVGSVVRGNHISGVIGETTRALAAQGDDVLFEDNVVTNNEGDGLNIRASGCTFRRNKIVKNGGFDVTSSAAQDANTFEDNQFGDVDFP